MTYSIQSGQLLLQLLRNLIRLLQILEIALHPLDLLNITPVLERGHGLIGMLLLLAEEVDLGGRMLEQVSNDAEPNAC